MTIQQHNTAKLFYGKWAYKVSTVIDGGRLLRLWTPAKIKQWCVNHVPVVPVHSDYYWQYARRNWQDYIDRVKLLDYITLLEPFLSENIQLRIESSTTNIFLADRELYEKLTVALNKYIVEVTEPASDQELQALLANKKTVIVDEYPHGQYQYRILFKELPNTVKESLREWLAQYSANDVFINTGTMEYLNNDRMSWGENSCYVRTAGMVMLITLAASGYIRRTEEFTLRSSINTNPQGELLC